MKHKRPFLMYVLVLVFIGAGLLALLGLIGMLRSWNWYLTYAGFPPPVYAVFRGAFLFLAWLIAAVALWKGANWAVVYSGFLSVINLLWFWGDRLLLTQNPVPFNRNGISLVLSSLLTVMVLVSLHFVKPYMRGPDHAHSNSTGEK